MLLTFLTVLTVLTVVRRFVGFSLLGVGAMGWFFLARAPIVIDVKPPTRWQTFIVALWLVIVPLFGIWLFSY